MLQEDLQQLFTHFKKVFYEIKLIIMLITD